VISIRTLTGTSIPEEQRTRLLQRLLVVMGGAAVAACILVPMAGLLVVVGCVALWFAGLVCNALRGQLDGMLLWWAGIFPLGYYFASFPREHALVTLDRVVVFTAFMGLILTDPDTRIAVPRPLRLVGLAWLSFAVVVGVSLRESPNVLNGAQNLLEGFVLPPLLGWCVIARFDVRRQLPTIHTAVCICSITCAAVAAAEIATGQDLLPLGTPATVYAGIVRPNGPFESNDTLALIGAVSLFFLLFLRATFGPKLRTGRRMLHSIGLAAAVGMALMPMFRSVAITLLLVLIIDTFWEKKTTRRAWRAALMFASVGLILLIAVFAPDVFEDRSSAGNVYGRVAQYGQSFRVFVEHPVLGVGFLNFHDFVVGEPHYFATYEGVSSVDWPHSNLAQILTETGLLGFVPYVMMQLLLLRAMWRLRQFSTPVSLGWKYFVYLFLTYWITGLTESSGYSPLNLWYVFAIAVVYKYMLTEPELVQPSDEQVKDEATSAPSSVFLPAFPR
jgi:O-antigen ligase